VAFSRGFFIKHIFIFPCAISAIKKTGTIFKLFVHAPLTAVLIVSTSFIYMATEGIIVFTSKETQISGAEI